MSTTAMTKPNNAQVAKSGNLGALQGLLNAHKDQIAVALPRHMTPERMIRVALTAYSNTPGLAECNPVTIAACIVQSSTLGLEPSTVLGEAYLVPFWNSKAREKQCQLIPGYMGLLKLARQSGEVSMIDAQIVYSNDDFEFHKGSDVWWRHKWNRTGDRGEPEGVWAGYVLKDNSKNFEYWTLEQIERHRDRYSKGAYDKDRQLTGVWRDSPEWMWKKTVLRQLIKLMPKSIELATALSLDERAENGLSQVLDVPAALQVPMADEEAPTTPEPPPTPKRRSAAPEPPAETPDPAPPEQEEGEPDVAKISASQVKRFWAIAFQTIGKESAIALAKSRGFHRVDDITTDAYDALIAEMQKGDAQ